MQTDGGVSLHLVECPRQGLAANLITATLVVFASKFGLPVSTTHVSFGAIAGVGARAHTLDWAALRNVLLSWVTTLPLAAVVAWCAVSSFDGGSLPMMTPCTHTAVCQQHRIAQ